MSMVTNVILKTSVFEEKGIGELNALFGSEFKSCDDESLPCGWYAGSKFLECGIYPAAFNFLNLEELVSAIRQVPWKRPKDVQLLIQEQEEDRFKEINIFEV